MLKFFLGIGWKANLLLALAAILLVAGAYYYAYDRGRDACESGYAAEALERAAKDLEIQTREALVNKREAEAALTTFKEREVTHEIIYQRVEADLKANPLTDCKLDDSFVQQLESIKSAE